MEASCALRSALAWLRRTERLGGGSGGKEPGERGGGEGKELVEDDGLDTFWHVLGIEDNGMGGVVLGMVDGRLLVLDDG